MENRDKFKIKLENVPNSIEIETIELIFESPKYCGKGHFEIVSRSEIFDDDVPDCRNIELEYSSQEDVETILKTGIIDYKMMKFYPMAVQSKTGIIGVDRIKVEFDLGSDDNTQIQEKNDDEMGIDLESFEYIIDSCQYPFYLFDFNVNLLNEFKNKIKTDINSSIKFRDDRKLVIECKQEQLGESYESWTRKVAMVLEDFSMKNCAIFEIKNFQDENLRVYIRDKAIGFFSESKDVSLVYKNEPNAFIRIEGDFNSIELAKSKLIEEIESFNKVIKNELNLIDKSHATVF